MDQSTVANTADALTTTGNKAAATEHDNNSNNVLLLPDAASSNAVSTSNSIDSLASPTFSSSSVMLTSSSSSTLTPTSSTSVVVDSSSISSNLALCATPTPCIQNEAADLSVDNVVSVAAAGDTSGATTTHSAAFRFWLQRDSETCSMYSVSNNRSPKLAHNSEQQHRHSTTTSSGRASADLQVIAITGRRTADVPHSRQLSASSSSSSSSVISKKSSSSRKCPHESGKVSANSEFCDTTNHDQQQQQPAKLYYCYNAHIDRQTTSSCHPDVSEHLRMRDTILNHLKNLEHFSTMSASPVPPVSAAASSASSQHAETYGHSSSRVTESSGLHQRLANATRYAELKQQLAHIDSELSHLIRLSSLPLVSTTQASTTTLSAVESVRSSTIAHCCDNISNNNCGELGELHNTERASRPGGGASCDDVSHISAASNRQRRASISSLPQTTATSDQNRQKLPAAALTGGDARDSSSCSSAFSLSNQHQQPVAFLGIKHGDSGDRSINTSDSFNNKSAFNHEQQVHSASSTSTDHHHQHHHETNNNITTTSSRRGSTNDDADFERSLLALVVLSRNQESCMQMRQASTWMPHVVQMMYNNNCDLTSASLAVRRQTREVLYNLVYCMPNDKRGKRERRIFELLDEIRAHSEQYVYNVSEHHHQSDGGRTQTVKPDATAALGALLKRSFEEYCRHTICLLGGLQAVCEVLQVDECVQQHTMAVMAASTAAGNDDDDAETASNVLSLIIKRRKWSAMILTNLTCGDGVNKALVCSSRGTMQALVTMLGDETAHDTTLCQAATSVMANLTWRPDMRSKQALLDCGAAAALVQAAMRSSNSNNGNLNCSNLKNLLSTLWNLSSHGDEEKTTLCAMPGALNFLIDLINNMTSATLMPTTIAAAAQTPSAEKPALLLLRSSTPMSASLTVASTPSAQQVDTLSIVENATGVLRNLSACIATNEQYRVILRERGAFIMLLKQLCSSSLTVVTNVCGTLANLSLNSAQDQALLLQLGALNMLRQLTRSKNKMIAVASSATMKNLLQARAVFRDQQQQQRSASNLSSSCSPAAASTNDYLHNNGTDGAATDGRSPRVGSKLRAPTPPSDMVHAMQRAEVAAINRYYQHSNLLLDDRTTQHDDAVVEAEWRNGKQQHWSNGGGGATDMTDAAVRDRMNMDMYVLEHLNNGKNNGAVTMSDAQKTASEHSPPSSWSVPAAASRHQKYNNNNNNGACHPAANNNDSCNTRSAFDSHGNSWQQHVSSHNSSYSSPVVHPANSDKHLHGQAAIFATNATTTNRQKVADNARVHTSDFNLQHTNDETAKPSAHYTANELGSNKYKARRENGSQRGTDRISADDEAHHNNSSNGKCGNKFDCIDDDFEEMEIMPNVSMLLPLHRSPRSRKALIMVMPAEQHAASNTTVAAAAVPSVVDEATKKLHATTESHSLMIANDNLFPTNGTEDQEDQVIPYATEGTPILSTAASLDDLSQLISLGAACMRNNNKSRAADKSNQQGFRRNTNKALMPARQSLRRVSSRGIHQTPMVFSRSSSIDSLLIASERNSNQQQQRQQSIQLPPPSSSTTTAKQQQYAKQQQQANNFAAPNDDIESVYTPLLTGRVSPNDLPDTPATVSPPPIQQRAERSGGEKASAPPPTAQNGMVKKLESKPLHQYSAYEQQQQLCSPAVSRQHNNVTVSQLPTDPSCGSGNDGDNLSALLDDYVAQQRCSSVGQPLARFESTSRATKPDAVGQNATQLPLTALSSGNPQHQPCPSMFTSRLPNETTPLLSGGSASSSLRGHKLHLVDNVDVARSTTRSGRNTSTAVVQSGATDTANNHRQSPSANKNEVASQTESEQRVVTVKKATVHRRPSLASCTNDGGEEEEEDDDDYDALLAECIYGALPKKVAPPSTIQTESVSAQRTGSVVASTLHRPSSALAADDMRASQSRKDELARQLRRSGKERRSLRAMPAANRARAKPQQLLLSAAVKTGAELNAHQATNKSTTTRSIASNRTDSQPRSLSVATKPTGDEQPSEQPPPLPRRSAISARPAPPKLPETAVVVQQKPPPPLPSKPPPSLPPPPPPAASQSLPKKPLLDEPPPLPPRPARLPVPTSLTVMDINSPNRTTTFSTFASPTTTPLTAASAVPLGGDAPAATNAAPNLLEMARSAYSTTSAEGDDEMDYSQHHQHTTPSDTMQLLHDLPTRKKTPAPICSSHRAGNAHQQQPNPSMQDSSSTKQNFDNEAAPPVLPIKSGGGARIVKPVSAGEEAPPTTICASMTPKPIRGGGNFRKPASLRPPKIPITLTKALEAKMHNHSPTFCPSRTTTTSNTSSSPVSAAGSQRLSFGRAGSSQSAASRRQSSLARYDNNNKAAVVLTPLRSSVRSSRISSSSDSKEAMKPPKTGNPSAAAPVEAAGGSSIGRFTVMPPSSLSPIPPTTNNGDVSINGVINAALPPAPETEHLSDTKLSSSSSAEPVDNGEEVPSSLTTTVLTEQQPTNHISPVLLQPPTAKPPSTTLASKFASALSWGSRMSRGNSSSKQHQQRSLSSVRSPTTTSMPAVNGAALAMPTIPVNESHRQLFRVQQKTTLAAALKTRAGKIRSAQGEPSVVGPTGQAPAANGELPADSAADSVVYLTWTKKTNKKPLQCVNAQATRNNISKTESLLAQKT